MAKIYVGIMDNGSEDAHIRCISADVGTVLKKLQRDFLEWHNEYATAGDVSEQDEDEDDGRFDLKALRDPSAPTLQEMDAQVPGYGVEIVEVDDGADLNEELRCGFDGGRAVKDIRFDPNDGAMTLELQAEEG